jgi:glycosyltransferase involved in cell wall biosynthesis
MRVLHIIASIRESAGTSVFVIELCEKLRAIGVDSLIAVEKKDDRDMSTTIPVIEERDLRPMPSGFDCIHVHGIWSLSTHRMLAKVRRLDIPCLLSPHGMLTPWALNFRKWKKRLAMWAYQSRDLQRADMFHVTAESEKEDLRRLGYMQPSVIVPLGVTPPASQEKVPKLGRVILFLSRVHPKKGLFNLIKAWQILKADPPNDEVMKDWRIVIAGPDESGHLKELKREIDRLGLTFADLTGDFDVETWGLCPQKPDVTFTGAVLGEEKDKLHRLADLFVLPSFSENFGVVVPDAMAYGLPVITTKGTPWSELDGTQEVGRCGWWIDIGVHPLVNALREATLLTDEKRREMGLFGKILVESRYTWDAVARKMFQAYTESCKRKR